MKKHFFAALLAGAAMVLCQPANAQWLTQTITVTNGWTAAYLFVDSSNQTVLPSTPNLPIGPGNPIDKIWLWQTPALAQYISSPASPLSTGGPWAFWGLTNSQNTLTALRGNAAYLIHSTAPTNYTWQIQGHPVLPQYTWDMTGLNLVGFSTPSVNPPNLYNFFAQDGVNANFGNIAQIYQYMGGEFSSQPPLNPAPVISQFSTPMTRGKAFWISATTINNTYFGPFQINLPDPMKGLNYGTSGGQITFHLVNLSPNTLTVSMKLLASEAPPFGATPIFAPPSLLLEGALNTSNLTYAYSTVAAGGSPTSFTLPPYGQAGSDFAVVVGLNRYAMTGPRGSLYAGTLQFTDSLGLSQLNVPVSATTADYTGLWVGSAAVSNVNYDLKTYATNSHGAYTVSNVTVNVSVTNPPVATTNLLIKNSITTSVVTNYFTVTNQVYDIFTTNISGFVTNSFAFSTNWNVISNFTTNIVIDTEVTDFYFDTDDNLIWVTSNTTNPPAVTVQSFTNQVAVSNLLGTLLPTGTPVTVNDYTNENTYFYTLLVTNGAFLDPVTNLVSSNFIGSVFPSAPYTNTSFNAITPFQNSVTLTNTNPPVVLTFSNNTNIVSPVSTTNYYQSPTPLQVIIQTNANRQISVSVATNCYAITNLTFLYFTTNSQAITNNYVVAGVSGTPALLSSSTNLLSTQTYYNPSVGVVSTNYTNLSIIYITNAWVVTNQLVSPVSTNFNYLLASHYTNLDAVTTPYPLRLIVFNDGSGNCSLLQRVYYGLDTAGNHIISTTQSALDRTQLSSARRVTATHLPWSVTNSPWAFNGGTLAQGSTLTTSPIIEYYDDQASNPFLHTYHPDHNNLDTQSPPHELAPGAESFTITRVISLTVAPNTDDFLSLTAANTRLSGSYYETISIGTKSYQTAGGFSLIRISTNATLRTQ